jgi:hypothetical protein
MIVMMKIFTIVIKILMDDDDDSLDNHDDG